MKTKLSVEKKTKTFYYFWNFIWKYWKENYQVQLYAIAWNVFLSLFSNSSKTTMHLNANFWASLNDYNTSKAKWSIEDLQWPKFKQAGKKLGKNLDLEN